MLTQVIFPLNPTCNFKWFTLPYSRFPITRVIVLASSYLFLTQYTSGYIAVNVTKRLKNWKNCILIQIKYDLLELFYLTFYIARYRWILWDLYFYFISWMTVFKDVAFSRKSALLLKLRTLIAMYAKFIPIFAWNLLFYFLLQGIILILKCSRYFICSESIKKMSIFVWYLVLFSFFQEINADSHKNSHRPRSRNWIFYL